VERPAKLGLVASDFNSARVKLVVSGQPLSLHRQNGCMLAVRVEYEVLQEAPEKHGRTVSLELRPISLLNERNSPPSRENGLVPAE
jgi:hypothetical protein